MYTDPTGEVFGVDDALVMLAFAYIGGLQANLSYCASDLSNPANPGNWDWSSPRTFLGIASGAMTGYSVTQPAAMTTEYSEIGNLLACNETTEYAYDIVTNQKFYLSNMGGSSTDFYVLGHYTDAVSALWSGSTVVVENASLWSGLYGTGYFSLFQTGNTLYDRMQSFKSSGELWEYEPTKMDDWSESNNPIKKSLYGMADNYHVTAQNFTVGAENAKHLNGYGVVGSEALDAGISTLVDFVPFSKGSKVLGFNLKPLNVAEFNTLYKGTGIYAAKNGGVYIRQTNYAIRQANNANFTWKTLDWSFKVMPPY